jgi:lysophospholipase
MFYELNKRKKVFILLSFFFSLNLLAVSENVLEKVYKEKIFPYYLNTAFKSTFLGKKNKKIAFYRFAEKNNKKSRGVLLFLTGNTEAAMKYIEVAYDFMNLGFTVYVMNHRGHGLSDKLTKVPGKTYIDDYRFFLDDVETMIGLINKVHSKKEMEKFFIIGHSMGGGVLSKFLSVRNSNNEFNLKGAILCSPLMNFKFGKVTKWVLSKLINILSYFGHSEMDAPTRPRGKIIGNFKKNKKTHSRRRYENIFFLAKKYPQTWISGITIGWLQQAFLMVEDIVEKAEKIKIPLLLLQPELDTYVDTKAQDKFCQKAKNCQKKVFLGAYHELFSEEDKYRDSAIQTIVKFIDDH